ncbi:MAG: hypothetical protein MHPDNHAH_01354 [Anaerolineales bacterium]|nr:hypothetical protein [Anaerolineales bacterium]
MANKPRTRKASKTLLKAKQNKNQQSNQAKSTASKARIKLTETLLIAISPIVAYSIIFAYNYGYFSVFRIPIQLIEFSVGQVFIVAVALAGLTGSTFYAANFLSTFLFKLNVPEPINKRLRKSFPIYLLFIVNFVLLYKYLQEWLSSLVLLLVFFFIDFIVPLFTQSAKKGYLKKLEAADKVAKKADANSVTVIDKILQVFDIGMARFVAYFVIGIAMITQLGRASAIRQEQFYITNTNPEMAVLYMTNTHAVLVEFDRLSNKIADNYKIVELGQDTKLTFRNEKIGRLSLASTEILFEPNNAPTATTVILTPLATYTLTPKPKTTTTLMPTLTLTSATPSP